MKKIFLLLFVSFLALSCSIDDGANDYYYEILPVESNDLPESFEFGKIYTITLTYKRPTDCHGNATLYFEKEGSTRTIAIQTIVANKNNCEAVPNEDSRELKFQFEVLSDTPYVFKFYKGEDEAGEALFESVTVPIIN